jgi:hypothetical protein
VNPLTVVSVVFVAVVVLAGIGMVVYVVATVGKRFFGEDPGGRDPNLPGQFLMWGNGPNYIDFLREKRRRMRKKPPK